MNGIFRVRHLVNPVILSNLLVRSKLAEQAGYSFDRINRMNGILESCLLFLKLSDLALHLDFAFAEIEDEAYGLTGRDQIVDKLNFVSSGKLLH
jgi:hypothetical protein